MCWKLQLDEMESFNPPSTEPLTDMAVTEETGGSIL